MANAETQVVTYQPGTTTRLDYLRTVRNRLDTITQAERNPGEIVDDLRQFTEQNIANLLGLADSAHTELGDVTQGLENAHTSIRRRNWGMVGIGVAGALIAALTFGVGYNKGDSNLRPHYNQANANYDIAVQERNTAIKKASEGLAREQIKDESLDDILKIARESGCLPKEESK